MQFIEVHSLDDPRLNAYINLTELQLRNRLEPSMGLFIAESMKVITRALAAHVEPVSFLIEQQWLESMHNTFAAIDAQWGPDIPVFIGDVQLLEQLTGYRLHRGALAAMRRWELPSVEALCAQTQARHIAIMENIVDPTNVGALMRSAAALGIDAVLVSPSSGDPLYRRAARVSMGTVFQIPWTRIGTDKHDWPEHSLERLHALGFTTVAMALRDDSIDITELARRTHLPTSDPEYIEKVALIFGTEGEGLSKRTIRASDLTVRIAMDHGVDSLNVAASSAVACYAIR